MSDKQQTIELANYQERLGAAYAGMLPEHAKGCYQEAAWLYRSIGREGLAKVCESEINRI